MTWEWAVGWGGVCGFLFCSFASLPPAGLFSVASSDAPALSLLDRLVSLLGRIVSYLLLAFFWGGEVVVDDRFAEHTPHNTRTHTHIQRGDVYIHNTPKYPPTAIRELVN